MKIREVSSRNDVISVKLDNGGNLLFTKSKIESRADLLEKITCIHQRQERSRKAMESKTVDADISDYKSLEGTTIAEEQRE